MVALRRNSSIGSMCIAAAAIWFLVSNRLAAENAPVVPHPTTATGARSVSVPKPPEQTGCYRFDGNKWERIQCLPPAVAARLPHMAIGGSTPTFAPPAPCFGTCGAKPGGFITAASTSISWTPASPWGITDSGTGRLSFSVQTNTNYFLVDCHPGSAPSGQDSCVPGHTGWVQFTYQYDFGWNGLFGNSALCVWNVDVTSQSYPNSCVGVPGLGYWDTGTGPDGVLTVMGGESGQNVWTMGCLPWVSGPP
jgi:hypothetical protein